MYSSKRDAFIKTMKKPIMFYLSKCNELELSDKECFIKYGQVTPTNQIRIMNNIILISILKTDKVLSMYFLKALFKAQSNAFKYKIQVKVITHCRSSYLISSYKNLT